MLESRAISSLATLYIVRMLGLFMILPVLKTAGDEYQGSTPYLMAVALGAYGFSQALLQMPFGVLSDRFGRKPLIAIGLTLFMAGSLMAGFAESVEWLIVGRILQGSGAIAGVIMAMVGDLTSIENRSKAMASIGASIGVAFALSLVIGPYLTGVFDGVRVVFFVSAGFSLLGFLVLLFLVPTPPKQERKPLLAGIGQVIRHPDLVRLNISVFILHALLMLVFITVPPLLKYQLEVVEKQQAWFYLKIVAVAFAVMIPMMIIAERRGRAKELMFVAALLMLLAMLTLALVPINYGWLVFAVLVFFIGFNYFEASLPSLMTKIVPVQFKGAGSGAFSTCQFLGTGVGSIGAGWLGAEWALWAAMLLIVLWCLILVPLKVPSKP